MLISACVWCGERGSCGGKLIVPDRESIEVFEDEWIGVVKREDGRLDGSDGRSMGLFGDGCFDLIDREDVMFDGRKSLAAVLGERE